MRVRLEGDCPGEAFNICYTVNSYFNLTLFSVFNNQDYLAETQILRKCKLLIVAYYFLWMSICFYSGITFTHCV